MRRKECTIGLLAMFLISILAVPQAIAEESIVGVVYKGWSQSECQSSFSGQPVTNDYTTLGILDQDLVKYTGPLTDPRDKQKTNCYCDNGYIMDTNGERCVECKVLAADKKNAVYYTDENAAKGSDAILKIGTVDRGCRCKQNLGNSVFIGKDSKGICQYKEVTQAQKDACSSKYPDSVPCVADKSAKAGSVEVSGETVDCCCKSGYNLDNGNCVKEGGTGPPAGPTDEGNKLCNQYVPGAQECTKDLVPKFFGGTYDKAGTPENYINEEFGVIGSTGKKLFCCCPTGQVEVNGKCMSNSEDPCWKIVSGSVEGSRGDADTDYPVSSTFKTLDGRTWKADFLNQIKQQKLECYCKEDYLPYGKEDLTECKTGEIKENMLFLGKTRDDFINIFYTHDEEKKGVLFNYVKSTSQEDSAPVPIKYIDQRLYDGIVITDTGVLDFYNKDSGRKGRWGGEAVAAILEGGITGGIGIWSAKKSAKWASQIGMQETGKKLAEIEAENAAKDAVTGIADNQITIAGTVLTKGQRPGSMGTIHFTESFDEFGERILLNLEDNLYRRGGSAALTKYSDAGRLFDFADSFSDESLNRIGRKCSRVMKAPAGLGDSGYIDLAKTLIRNYDGIADATLKDAVEKSVGKEFTTQEALNNLRSSIGSAVTRANIFGATGSKITGNIQSFVSTVASSTVSNRFRSIWAGIFRAGLPIVSKPLDELVPETSGWKTWTLVGAGCISGGINGFLAGAGLGSWISTPAGCVIGMASTYFSDKVDPTDMDIRWKASSGDYQTVVKDVENIILVNDQVFPSYPFSGLEKSGFRFFPTSYQSSKIEGWAMSTLNFRSRPTKLWEAGGDFIITMLEPTGYIMSCSDCHTTTDGQMCGDNKKVVTSFDNQKLSGTPICCGQCIILEGANQDRIAYYYGMPGAEQDIMKEEGGFSISV